MITGKFVPVKEKQAEEWSGTPTVIKWQEALKAHAGVNASRRTAAFLAIALLAYAVGALLATYIPWLVYVGGAAFLVGEIRCGMIYLDSRQKARQADEEYMRGIKEVPVQPDLTEAPKSATPS